MVQVRWKEGGRVWCGAVRYPNGTGAWVGGGCVRSRGDRARSAVLWLCSLRSIFGR